MKHHSMLHSNTVKSDNSENKASGSRAVTNHHTGGKASLFRILPVTLHGNNCSISVFAFLDDGSECTLVEDDVVKKLGVEGRLSSTKHKLVDVRTVSKLDLPRQSIQYAKLAETCPYLRGLPVQDFEKAVPCILIGDDKDNAHVTATLKLREGQPGEPVAAKTRLGWTIYGKNSCKSESPAHIFHICECYKDESLHDLVTQFFSVESLGITETACPESEEVQRANQILRATTKRMGPRFETGLIWKYDKFEFPDSYAMAVRRLECLERRIRSDPVIGESVMRQMREYQIKGYIHKATEEELEGADPWRVWYLPLGVALNPKKPTKVPICSTVYWRCFLVFEKEMFHQVQIRKEDRHAQRLLWREHSSHEPDIYLMDVATFGAACSPCSAQFVKNLNAAEHAESFPAAVDAILRKHYVDDYLDSADNVDEAVKLALEIKHVHSLGGFQLRNWLSNSQDVLARVGDNDSVAEKSLQLDKDSVTERVLGVFWKLEKDMFTFSSAMSTHEERPTKRQALSIVMSTFDPLGFLAHFTIRGKIVIQSLWRAQTIWDELIPNKLCEQWTAWTRQFQCLHQVRIARCYFPHRSVNQIISLQLHVFVNASEEAFACVAYFRAEFKKHFEVALIAGKSKVAPLKVLSIPRMELLAAVIGVRLMNTIIDGHTLRIDECTLWSDSKTVLAWINSDHRKYRQFVACRVGEILTKTKQCQWRWIPSKDNVADDATKWGKNLVI
ncbi:uncharacterized protein LOC134222608 [Armigeres subalbatus]|uniref:uncharacterized protein LOC134222608 n=1 Tax=Armigeres subalbatus TaxID=124917 RepID=UPI002ED19AF2